MNRFEVIKGLCLLAEYFEKRSKHDRAEDRPLSIERMNVCAEAAAMLMAEDADAAEEDDGK